ncbi:uncharacterized protein B0J16DRAFT_317604 [Fusarium flagelliforme]|uniref:Peptidase s8 and s53 subtilisin kexin sedolisin n=1 Tax=Fusarium flagelliforme TaxID=2675880 RepID=A0A395N2Y2_9HYPO|nr:uncharacterized protein B0J16DRAFT_317604 [Fusarium flagelliforme]KAH7193956.1 hypothetical protein B0J16DRAFT_317604 [Fusarium flagelliforme]RFN54451.1 peptidase s8 and s53 subtilisin kexin sedolisin [Fusarium flagelliforme]
MKWHLFLALGGPARAIASLQPIGEPQWNDGVVCYTYLSTYLVAIAVETTEPDFPTLPSFPTTRGIVPPYFSNRSTLVPPSVVTEASEINENPATVIDITTSDFAIPTDDQEDAETTATGSGSLFPPTSATSTEASATSSEAVLGQAVIFFVSPQIDNEKRDIVKRAPGGFIGSDNINVDICTNAGTFRLGDGQLFDLQDPIYYNGESYKEFRSEGTPPTDAVTREFSNVAGALVFANRALPNTNAGFCQEEDSGRVYITFTSSPPGCVPVSLRVYAVEQCQDGRIIGLDPAKSATTEPNQPSTIAETRNTASTEMSTFSEDSSSTALTGQTSSVQLSQSSDSFPETTETTPSLSSTESSTVDETTTATSDSQPEGSSSFPSFSSSSPSTETYLSFTTSIETSITSESFISLLSSLTTTASSDSFSSDSTLSSDSLSSIDTISSEPTSSLSMISSTESAITSEVSTTITEESKTTTEESATDTGGPTTSTEETTAEEPITTTTEEPTTTTTSLCNSVDLLTTVALANPTPVFNDESNPENGFASITIPWDLGLAGTEENVVYINTNGYITLGSGDSNPFNRGLPSNSIPDRAYLPYWDSLILDPSQGHTIVYEIFDGIFGPQLTVEFILGKPSRTGIYHFEASFFENEPQLLRFRYYTTPDKGSSATAGFQDVLAGNYAEVSVTRADRLLDGVSVIVATNQIGIFSLSSFDNTECGKEQDRLP